MNSQATSNPDIHVLEQLLAVGRRRWWIVVILAVSGALLGIAYALSQVPVYSTSATVMVRSGPAVDPLRQGIETSTPEEEGQFLSQLELARSASVARIVADRLDLENDDAFARTGISRLRSLGSRFLGPVRAQPGELSRDQVLARLQSNVRVGRVGRTYVAAISYSHPDPAVAQKVAQAFAEAFRQKIAQENDLATSRLRATLQGEVDRAPPEEKGILQSRLQDAMVARALPGMDVVVMSDARLPAAPIAPRTGFITAVGLILGAVAGCAVAGLRELTDRGVRDGDALARLIGLRFLGYIPRRAFTMDRNVTIGQGQPLPEAGRRVLAEPYSNFGETVRSMGVAITSRATEGKGRVTGLASILPGEGATVLGVNLAAHLASLGHSVLLVDADSRHARLSKWLAAGAELGLVEALLQDRPVEECTLYEPKSNIALLPMVTGGDRLVEPSALFSSPRARPFFEKLGEQYQHVIVDFASLSQAADARAAASFVDGFLLTAPWGKVSPQFVVDLLACEEEVRARSLGFVLTRTNLKKLPLYAAAGSRAAYQRVVARG